MLTHAAIIDSFGGPAKYGAAIGITASHARVMKSRNSIAPDYWPITVTKANDKGIQGVTYDVLAKGRRPDRRRKRVNSRVMAA